MQSSLVFGVLFISVSSMYMLRISVHVGAWIFRVGLFELKYNRVELLHKIEASSEARWAGWACHSAVVRQGPTTNTNNTATTSSSNNNKNNTNNHHQKGIMRDRAVSSARGITTPQTIVSPRSIQFELCLATYIWIQIWRPSLSVSYLWSRWQVEKRRALFLKKNRGMAARAGLPWTVYRSLQSDRKLIRIDWFIHCFLVLKPTLVCLLLSIVL